MTGRGEQTASKSRALGTEFILLGMYGRPIVPVAEVCRDFFSHLAPEKFIRKVNEGQIRIPVVRMDDSAKTARGVHITHLAAYLDDRAEAAAKEARQLFGVS